MPPDPPPAFVIDEFNAPYVTKLFPPAFPLPAVGVPPAPTVATMAGLRLVAPPYTGIRYPYMAAPPPPPPPPTSKPAFVAPADPAPPPPHIDISAYVAPLGILTLVLPGVVVMLVNNTDPVGPVTPAAPVAPLQTKKTARQS